MLTNENSDFTIGNEGVSLEASEAVVPHRTFAIHEGETFYGGVWGRTADTAVLLQAQHNANLQVLSVGTGNVTLRAVTGTVEISTNSGNINIRRNDNNTITIGSTISINSATTFNGNLTLSPGSGTAVSFNDTRAEFSRNLRVRNVSESNRNSPSPEPGDIIFNTSSGKFNGWNGSEWRNLE